MEQIIGGILLFIGMVISRNIWLTGILVAMFFVMFYPDIKAIVIFFVTTWGT